MNVRDLQLDVRHLVNQWDPIGIADFAPDDEYDCLVAPLLGKLIAGANRAEISEFLLQQLEGHFGVDPVGRGVDSMADRLVRWWAVAAARANDKRPGGKGMKVPTELVGCEVHRIMFDHQVRICLVGLDPDEGYRVDAELVIETPFLLRDAGSEWHELDPGTGSAVAPVLDLFNDTVTTVEVNDRGALHLTFTDTAEIFVGPDARYESWHLTGHGVTPITVGPGGHADWQRR